MRTVGRWALRVAVALVLAVAVVTVWKREDLARLGAVLTLFEADRIVANFSAMDRAFLARPVPRGDGPSSPLPSGPALDLPPDVEGWIAARQVTGFVVLREGVLVAERYRLGTGAQDLRINWSISKSYLSVLLGTLVAEGAVALDDPVTRHAPTLAGSAYDGATVRDVLTMSSGVAFDEDYLDFWTDINRMGRVLGLGGSMDAFTRARQDRIAAPGGDWRYVSLDTHVLGMVIRGATGRDVPSLLSERIVGPLGFEGAPYYVTDGLGVAFVLGGLNTTTRDNARFGQLIAQGGRWQGRQIVPADWIAASIAPQARTAQGALGYGYQWWVPRGAAAGEVMAHGIYGQYIYIDQGRNVVIAVHAADRAFAEAGREDEAVEIFRTVAALAGADG